MDNVHLSTIRSLIDNPEMHDDNLDEHLDDMMVTGISLEMRNKLSEAAMHGRHGWWKREICDINHLRELRSKAIADNDHISVMNYTAMLWAREHIDANPS